jgi:hypothetical protein
VNCAIHASAASETGIGGVDDSIHANPGYIADHQAELLPMGEVDLHSFIVASGWRGEYEFRQPSYSLLIRH